MSEHIRHSGCIAALCNNSGQCIYVWCSSNNNILHMSSRSEILNTCCRGAAQSVLTVQEAVIKIQFPQGALCNMFCLLCAAKESGEIHPNLIHFIYVVLFAKKSF